MLNSISYKKSEMLSLFTPFTLLTYWFCLHFEVASLRKPSWVWFTLDSKVPVHLSGFL